MDFIRELNERFFDGETTTFEMQRLFNRMQKSIKNKMKAILFTNGKRMEGRVLYYTHYYLIAVVDGKKVKAKKFMVKDMWEVFFTSYDLQKLRRFLNGMSL